MELRIVPARPADPAPAPRYARSGDAAMDFYAAIPRDVWIWPLCRVAIPLGWRIAIPDGHWGLLKIRSGHANRNLVLTGGVIDSGFRGEPRAVIINVGWLPKRIRRHERVAQLVVMPFTKATPVEVSALDDTERGVGGFGHTGVL